MKTIEYADDGIGVAVSDFTCEQQAKDFLTGDQEAMCVSTSNFITAVRALIAEGFIPHTSVCFCFLGNIIRPDADGRLSIWPNGFCDVEEKFLCRILGATRKK
jgi:hypothetical protein